MYLRQNATQEFIGDARDTSQPTISRYTAALVPLVKSVLEEFVPDAAEAIEMVRGRVVLVDGTLTPCWSYEEHRELWNKKHKTTGFNAQLISLLDGSAVWISGPLPGKTHDAKAFKETGAADIVKESGGGFGDKGYQGSWPGHPEEEAERRRADYVRQGIQFPDRVPARAGRAACRPLQELEDIPLRLPPPVLGPMSTRSMPPGVFSSSRSHGVLNNAPSVIRRWPMVTYRNRPAGLGCLEPRSQDRRCKTRWADSCCRVPTGRTPGRSFPPGLAPRQRHVERGH